MKTELECYPCILKAAVSTLFSQIPNARMQSEMMRNVLDIMKDHSLDAPPIAVMPKVMKSFERITGINDPFLDIKRQLNEDTLSLLPDVRKIVDDSPDPFDAAVRFAIAGNVIDFGIRKNFSKTAVMKMINDAMVGPIHGSVSNLHDSLSQSKGKVLYLLDNVGEITFDTLLLSRLPVDLNRVTAVVRGEPVFNDALMEDARVTGIADIVKVVDNGSGAPGTLLHDCSPSFREIFNDATVIISKGQGNFEGLSDGVYQGKTVHYLLSVKCPVVSRALNAPMGTMAIHSVE